MIRTFTMYRRGKLPDTHSEKHKNAPDEPQFEGVVFSDGRCALRWLTPIGSVSVWDSLDDAITIHGHPEYDSEIVWHDDLDLYGKGAPKTYHKLKESVSHLCCRYHKEGGHPDVECQHLLPEKRLGLMHAYQFMKCWRYGMLGFDILPYQLSLGVTLRVLEGGLYFRLYVGPFKLLGGVNKMRVGNKHNP